MNWKDGKEVVMEISFCTFYFIT